MVWRVCFALIVCLAFVSTALAGDTGSIRGQVLDEQGIGIPGILVTLEGGGAGATRSATSGEDGSFTFADLPAPGRYRVFLTFGEHRTSRAVVTQPGQESKVTLPFSPSLLEEVTVTASREEQLLRETPATVSVVSAEIIDEMKPRHPSEVMDRVPGVWVSATNGEGHMTAIRQPLTTNPVYLYLEDGVPTRSTGFFNHNALYEINVPMSGGLEVTKGPGSALYGSDAIGGVINSLSRSPFGPAGFQLSAEGGEYEWARLLASAQGSTETGGFRGDFNLTRTDGWRLGTDYDREAGSFRWDRLMGDGWMIKTLATFSLIDQQTAGTSTLSEHDYEENPTLNLTPISFREVTAFRLSTDIRREMGSTYLSLIPYFRHNDMNMLPNWSLTYDPSISDSSNNSYGVLAKIQRDLPGIKGQVLTGVDIDLSPGHRTENIVLATTTQVLGRTIFSDYTLGATVYDYDVTFLAISPYAQFAFTPTNKLRAEFGLRYDHMGYDYDDLLETPETTRHRRPKDTSTSYDHLSPKLGVTYQANNRLSLFGGYKHAFRVPSEGQLFRQGSALNTVDLEPVKADQFEGGIRAALTNRFSFEVSAYHLEMRDDILSYRDPVDGSTQAVNAGETRHQGVEIGVYSSPYSWLDLSVAYGFAKHTYVEWAVDPARGVDYSGNEQETAPQNIANFVVSVRPVSGSYISLEVFYLGPYWMDAANTQEYEGHTLLTLRGNARIFKQFSVFARVQNLTDERYAESTSYTIQRGRELAPGMPRTFYIGLDFEWGK